MFDEERALRDKHGNPVNCNACGQQLHLAPPGEASSAFSPTHNTIESE
jgi:hypothetical protein